jgi:hypothetical protein
MKALVIFFLIPAFSFGQLALYSEDGFNRVASTQLKDVCKDFCCFSLDLPEYYKGDFGKLDKLKGGFVDRYGNLIVTIEKIEGTSYANFILWASEDCYIGSLFTASENLKKEWLPFSSLPLFILTKKDRKTSHTFYYIFDQISTKQDVKYKLISVTEIDANGVVLSLMEIDENGKADIYCLSNAMNTYNHFKGKEKIEIIDFNYILKLDFNALNKEFVKTLVAEKPAVFIPEGGGVLLIDSAN